MTDPLADYWNAKFEQSLDLPKQAEDGSIEHRYKQQELYDMRPALLERLEREWEKQNP